MFFIAGINQKQEELDFRETVICDACGAYGSYNIIKEFTQLSLFFLPVFKWGIKYYVRMTCCGSLYELDKEIGRDIESGRISKIDSRYLHPISVNRQRVKKCSNCGYVLDSDFEFCPRCGTRIGG